MTILVLYSDSIILQLKYFRKIPGVKRSMLKKYYTGNLNKTENCLNEQEI